MNKTGWLLVSVGLLLAACGTDELAGKERPLYNGPVLEVTNMETLYSDSARVRVRMTAPRELDMENGDRQFPDGVHIDFYGENGSKETTLTSNKGFYTKAENRYTVTGNVVIRNLKKEETLNTEVLNWNPGTKKIFTDTFVTIETPKEVLKGTGLEAQQDFSSYRINNPTGKFATPGKQ